MGVDFIIVGQGISGTFLSYYLGKAGASCIVIDDNRSNTASKVAAGLINPVTGRRLVKSWIVDELMPFAWDAYHSLGDSINGTLINEANLLQFFNAPDMQDAFNKKLKEGADYLGAPGDANWREFFNYPFGWGIIKPCYIVSVKELIVRYRKGLEERGQLLEQNFDPAALHITGTHVCYKDVTAAKIIFCDGAAVLLNPWFNRLPYSMNKGEALTLRIPDLPLNNIYKFRHTLIPVHADEPVFWFGSNYEWTYTNDEPSQNFRESAEAELKHFLKLPYTVIDHQAAIRPANIERRPYAGLHPIHDRIGILNGMGTKGCSLAPYFANQLAAHLVHGAKLLPAVDVGRYQRVLNDERII